MIFEATKVTAVLSAQSVYVGIHEAGVPSTVKLGNKELFGHPKIVP